jgi:hypothetical protein
MRIRDMKAAVDGTENQKLSSCLRMKSRGPDFALFGTQ